MRQSVNTMVLTLGYRFVRGGEVPEAQAAWGR